MKVMLVLLLLNTYKTTLKPLYILQEKAIRILTLADYNDNSSPIFRKLKHGASL